LGGLIPRDVKRFAAAPNPAQNFPQAQIYLHGNKGMNSFTAKSALEEQLRTQP
jgi:hypothetical protein